MVVVYAASTPTGAGVYITKHLADGALDATHGIGGVAVQELVRSPANFFYGGASRQVDGKIIVVGCVLRQTTPFASGLQSDVFIARLEPDGRLDRTCGLGGMVPPSSTLGYACLRDVAIQGDGRIVVGGSAGDDLIFARLSSSGAFDPSFGVGGVARLSANVVMANSSPGDRVALSRLGISLDGFIVGGGARNRSGGAPGFLVNFIVRVNAANGQLDGGFGPVTFVAYEPSGGVMNLAVSDDATIVANGRWRVSGSADSCVAKLSSAGATNAIFGASGLKCGVYGPSPVTDPGQIAIQADGKIIVTGVVFPDGIVPRSRTMVTRLLGNGTFDQTFGNAGVVDLGTLPQPVPQSMLIQPAGKIVVLTNALGPPYSLVRLNP